MTAPDKCAVCDRPRGYPTSEECLMDAIHRDHSTCFDPGGDFCGPRIDWRSRALTLADEKRIAIESSDKLKAERDAALARVGVLGDALRAAMPYMERAAEPESSYGYVLVKDPRRFHPDPECSTEEERAHHKADCEAWDRGEHVRVAPVHASIDLNRSIAGQIKGADLAVLERDAEGNVIGGHVTRAGYGLGTSQLHDEEAEQALEIARAAIAPTTGENS